MGRNIQLEGTEEMLVHSVTIVDPQRIESDCSNAGHLRLRRDHSWRGAIYGSVSDRHLRP